MTTPHLASLARVRQGGFTMAELMIAVAMVTVLAMMSRAAYRRYLDSSKVSEPVAIVGAIRAAQESVRAETNGYLGNSTSPYPMGNSAPSSKRWAWQNPNHPDYNNIWQTLNVSTDGSVRYGYTVNTGVAGTQNYPAIGLPNPPQFPMPSPQPWYVIQAKGDPGDRGTSVHVLGHSFSGQISVSNEFQ